MFSSTLGLAGLTAGTLAVFAATVAGLLAAGLHKPDALARGPVRDVGWGPVDLAASIGLFALGLLLASVVGQALGLNPPADGAAEAPVITAATAALQMVVLAVLWLPAVVYLVARLARAGHLRLGGVVPRRPGRDLWVAAVATAVAFVLATGLSTLLQAGMVLLDQPLPEHGHVIYKTVAESDSRLLVVLLIVSAVVIAPIGEEFFFRGLLQTAVQGVIGSERRWLSILPCAVFFGVIHFSAVPGFMIPVLVVLGIVFGWVYERTGSLWCAVLVHAGFNATSFTLTLLLPGPSPEPGALGLLRVWM